eukprot:snap_masked-scaffold_7-processed-gene-4.21-mRNA-1 protein AED:1.00 eAED:1.00 QI:0/-1/0/0/-1/1/1/0/81
MVMVGKATLADHTVEPIGNRKGNLEVLKNRVVLPFPSYEYCKTIISTSNFDWNFFLRRNKLPKTGFIYEVHAQSPSWLCIT